MRRLWLVSVQLVLCCLLAIPALARKTPRGGTSTERLLQLVQQQREIDVIVGVSAQAKKNAVASRTAGAKKVHGRDFTSIPYFVLTVNEGALRQLLNDDDVTSIEENVAGKPALVQSTNHIGSRTVNAAGFTGEGQKIVIIDTGVADHAFFGNRILEADEACFSVSGANSLCAGQRASQVGVLRIGNVDHRASTPCSFETSSECGHGTQVAGIAASSDLTLTGVAPAAHIIPIQVYTKTNCNANGEDCTLSISMANVVAALDYVSDTLVPRYGKRLVVNISIALGASQPSRAACDTAYPALRDAIANLVAADVAVVAATGNDSLQTVMNPRPPACITGAIAVSATGDNTDVIAPYANRAAYIDLFAPGGLNTNPPVSQITTAQIPDGQGCTPASPCTMSEVGTSFAAPHVAGAIALLRQAAPTGVTARQLVDDVLRPTGAVIAGFTARRINVAAALPVVNCAHQLHAGIDGANPTLYSAQYTDSRTFVAQPNQQLTFRVEARNAAGAISSGITWSSPDLTDVTPAGVTSYRLYRTPAVTGQASYTLSAQVGTCRRWMKLNVGIAPFTLTAGHCSLSAAPIVRGRLYDKVTLTTELRDEATGALITDAASYRFQWSTVSGTSLSDGWGDAYAAYAHTFTSASVEDLRLVVTHSSGHQRSLTVDMQFDDTPPLTGCTASLPCPVTCTRRSILFNGAPSRLHRFTHPANATPVTATLTAPLSLPDATYQWHRATWEVADAIIANGYSIPIQLTEGAQYYVITTTPGGEQISDLFTLINEAYGALPSEVVVTPLHQEIAGGTNFVSITANLQADPPLPANTEIKYEWRQSLSYDDILSTIVGDKPTLVLPFPPEDAVYWCKIRTTPPPESGQHQSEYDSDFASLLVNCTTEVGGTIIPNPSNARVAAGQRPTLVAAGYGKQLTYTWYRRLPGGTPTVLGSWWNSITPGLTAPVTYFSADVVDVCGTSGSLAEIPVYLCVPTIHSQPAGGTYATTAAASLSINVTPPVPASQTITVKWYRASDPNMTTSLGNGLTFQTPVTPGTTDSFYAAITYSCGEAPNATTHTLKSATASVSVCANPQISTPATTISIRNGEQRWLGVSATGASLTYQWYAGNSGNTSTPLTGKTSDVLLVSPSVTTSYWCRVTSQGLCSANGPTMTVKVCNDPVINTHPVSQSVFSGTSATLSVAASGGTTGDPLTYQWYQQTTTGAWSIISGATSSSFTTPALTAAATYAVEVKTGVCTAFSNAATISICSYNASYAGTTKEIAYNETATLSLGTMSPALTKNITWYRGALGVKTNPVKSGSGIDLSYTTPALTATTTYWAEFENGGCTSRKGEYIVSVCKPGITAQPSASPSIVTAGSSSTLTVGTTPIAGRTYQWFIGTPGTTTNPIANSNAASISVTPAATTTYWVRVTGTCGTPVDSAAVTVTVCTAPTISSIAKTTTTDLYGYTGGIAVTASGTSLTYQWYKGASGDTSRIITGATAATYTFTLTEGEYYWVRVTSTCNGAFVNSSAIYYSVDPNITAHPQSVSIPSGTSTTLSVTATGRELTYQWHSGITGYGPAITGATSSTYMTPALSAETKYWVRVTSAATSQVNSENAVVSICAPPTLGTFTSTSIGTNSWRLTANVAVEDQERGVKYDWYTGVRSNPSQSTYLGEGSYYRNFYSVTQQTVVWVRVSYEDGSCYADTPSRTLTPQ